MFLSEFVFSWLSDTIINTSQREGSQRKVVFFQNNQLFCNFTEDLELKQPVFNPFSTSDDTSLHSFARVFMATGYDDV